MQLNIIIKYQQIGNTQGTKYSILPLNITRKLPPLNLCKKKKLSVCTKYIKSTIKPLQENFHKKTSARKLPPLNHLIKRPEVLFIVMYKVHQINFYKAINMVKDKIQNRNICI